MNGPPPITVAGSGHRFLLADEVAAAILAGRSVVLTHRGFAADVLGLVSDTLAEAGVRVLSLRALPDSTAFLAQFAQEWCVAGAGQERPGAMPPRGSDRRFAVVIDQAQTIPMGTFRQLESMVQAWPGMQLLLAGSPGVDELLLGEGQALIPSRAWATLAVPARRAVEAAPFGDGPASEEDAPVRGRRRGRAMAVWGIGLAALGLAILLAVPRIGPDVLEAARGVGLLPAEERPVGIVERSGEAAAPEEAAPAPPAPPAQVVPVPVPMPVPMPPDPAVDRRAEVEAVERDAGPAAAEPAPAVPPPPVVPEAPREAARGAVAGPGPTMAPDMVEAMTRRGLAMLDFGDVSAARLLLARAAAAGSGEAAFAMGTTFDAKTLERLGAMGIAPDADAAASWFRLALILGEERARAMLAEHPAGARSEAVP